MGWGEQKSVPLAQVRFDFAAETAIAAAEGKIFSTAAAQPRGQ
jgi:hypothetical protein